MKAGENRSDVESELESEDPTEVGDDMTFFEEEESQEVVGTSAECHDPMAMSSGGEWEVDMSNDVPVPRKRATSMDTISEWEAKWTRSPRPSVASLVSSPPIMDMAE